MINFDGYANENKFKMTIYSGSSIQYTNNRSFICINKCITKFNKQPTRY